MLKQISGGQAKHRKYEAPTEGRAVELLQLSFIVLLMPLSVFKPDAFPYQMQPRRVSLYVSECVLSCPSVLESVRSGGRVSIPTSCHLFQLPLLNPQPTRATGGLNDSLKLFRVYTISIINQATCDSDPAKHQLLVPLLIFNFAASQFFLPLARFLAPNGFCRLSNNITGLC